MTTDCTFKYNTLFGPVPSRRLGISLGVDRMHHKTCSLGCVDCECGAATHLTTKRSESVSTDRLKEELAVYLSQHEKIDYITFSGSGEPALNAGIGDVMPFLKSDYPQYKLALLINSALIGHLEVRRQVREADVVILNTLDRPGSESWVQPAEQNRLKDISEFLEGAEIVIYKTVQPETAKRYEDDWFHRFTGGLMPPGGCQGSSGLTLKRSSRFWIN
jgi:wyosine [tRNA(Phe)-imidazoG37] synthetase (radical SAM superfamily)